MLKPRLALVVLVLASLALAAEQKPLKFGITQPYGEEQAAKAKTALEPWLSKALGGPVTVVLHPTYEALSDALATGAVDFAWITPLAFVRAAKKNPDIQALAKAMRTGDGGLFYRSVLIVKKDSAVKTLAELKGTKVAWVNALSASGYLFPRELIRKEGLTLEGFFSAESFAGDHPGVCKAVREGRADVGATFASEAKEGQALKADGCLDAPPIDDFRVLASTGNLPNEVIALSSDFPSPRANDVLGTFGRMAKSAEGKALLKDVFRADGFGVAVDGDFAPVLEVLRATDVKAKVAVPPAPAKVPKKAK